MSICRDTPLVIPVKAGVYGTLNLCNTVLLQIIVDKSNNISYDMTVIGDTTGYGGKIELINGLITNPMPFGTTKIIVSDTRRTLTMTIPSISDTLVVTFNSDSTQMEITFLLSTSIICTSANIIPLPNDIDTKLCDTVVTIRNTNIPPNQIIEFKSDLFDVLVGAEQGQSVSFITESPNNIVVDFNTFKLNLLDGGFFMGIFDVDRTNVTLILSSGSLTELPPFPSQPPPNNNYCTNPIITIRSVILSNFNNDILEAIVDVQDGCVYDRLSNNNCYQGCLSLINNGTRFTIFLLFINCTLKLNIIPNQSTRNVIVIYSVLTLISGRVLCGSIDINWLFRSNYNILYNKIKCSRYCQFIPKLDIFSGLDKYFKC